MGLTGMGAAAMLAPRFATANQSAVDKKIRIGIIGGNFGSGFYFHEWPLP